MARTWDGIDDLIDCGTLSGMGGQTVLTLAFWGRRAGTVANFLPVGMRTDTNNGFILNIYSDGNVYCNPSNGGLQYGSFASNDTTLHHWGMVFDGNGSTNADKLKAYLDGANQTLSFTGTIPTTTAAADSSFKFGRSVPDAAFGTGDLSEGALWQAALTADEMGVLADGVCPLLVRPAALIHYWPIWGNHSPELDLVGGANGTLTGTTKLDHNRMIYPSRRRVIVSGAATTEYPWWSNEATYRKRRRSRQLAVA